MKLIVVSVLVGLGYIVVNWYREAKRVKARAMTRVCEEFTEDLSRRVQEGAEQNR